jgi:hypothetical protein
MEAHTPKREAVQRFISSNAGHAPGWKVRVIDEHDSPLIRLEAKQEASAAGDAVKTLEVHTRQVSLTHDEVDASTRKMLVRWLDSLTSGSRASSTGNH